MQEMRNILSGFCNIRGKINCFILFKLLRGRYLYEKDYRYTWWNGANGNGGLI